MVLAFAILQQFFVPSPISTDFGGAIAGPIRKDKIFFYYNTEKIFNRGVNYPYYTYPTADARAVNPAVRERRSEMREWPPVRPRE